MNIFNLWGKREVVCYCLLVRYIFSLCCFWHWNIFKRDGNFYCKFPFSNISVFIISIEVGKRGREGENENFFGQLIFMIVPLNCGNEMKAKWKGISTKLKNNLMPVSMIFYVHFPKLIKKFRVLWTKKINVSLSQQALGGVCDKSKQKNNVMGKLLIAFLFYFKQSWIMTMLMRF